MKNTKKTGYKQKKSNGLEIASGKVPYSTKEKLLAKQARADHKKGKIHLSEMELAIKHAIIGGFPTPGGI